jgi:HK97 gp10 family phage protein
MSVVIKQMGFNMVGLSRRLKTNIARELNSAAESFVSIARQLAPVSDINTPGYVHMRDQIEQTERATADHLRIKVESLADHSSFVEHGTVNMEAQPFMTPASESARKQFTGAVLRF